MYAALPAHLSADYDRRLRIFASASELNNVCRCVAEA